MMNLVLSAKSKLVLQCMLQGKQIAVASFKKAFDS